MTSTTMTADAAAVLAAARRLRAGANAAEAGLLAQAVAWAHLHKVDDLDLAATVLVEHGKDTGIPIAGDGAPPGVAVRGRRVRRRAGLDGWCRTLPGRTRPRAGPPAPEDLGAGPGRVPGPV